MCPLLPHLKETLTYNFFTSNLDGGVVLDTVGEELTSVGIDLGENVDFLEAALLCSFSSLNKVNRYASSIIQIRTLYKSSWISCRNPVKYLAAVISRVLHILLLVTKS